MFWAQGLSLLSPITPPCLPSHHSRFHFLLRSLKSSAGFSCPGLPTRESSFSPTCKLVQIHSQLFTPPAISPKSVSLQWQMRMHTSWWTTDWYQRGRSKVHLRRGLPRFEVRRRRVLRGTGLWTGSKRRSTLCRLVSTWSYFVLLGTGWEPPASDSPRLHSPRRSSLGSQPNLLRFAKDFQLTTRAVGQSMVSHPSGQLGNFDSEVVTLALGCASCAIPCFLSRQASCIPSRRLSRHSRWARCECGLTWTSPISAPESSTPRLSTLL